MRIRCAAVLSAALVCLWPALAAGQDSKPVGITMGYPTSVGLLWHASSRLALRPELTFNGTSSHSTAPGLAPSIPDFEVESSATVIGTGVSALLYLRTQDRLRLYVSPRFTYTHTSGSSSSPTDTPPIRVSSEE